CSPLFRELTSRVRERLGAAVLAEILAVAAGGRVAVRFPLGVGPVHAGPRDLGGAWDRDGAEDRGAGAVFAASGGRDEEDAVADPKVQLGPRREGAAIHVEPIVGGKPVPVAIRVLVEALSMLDPGTGDAQDKKEEADSLRLLPPLFIDAHVDDRRGA